MVPLLSFAPSHARGCCCSALHRFDPLEVRPTDAAAIEQMQTKELNHGRLAMIGIAGMVVQELATGEKLF